MEYKITKDPYWLRKWDQYVQTNDKGNHLILSDWLNSYASYNFDYEVCICLHNDEIIGGYGAVLAKILFLKFYIVPYGPIVSDGFEVELNGLIQQVVNRAKFHKSCYCHITLPYAIAENAHVFQQNSQYQVIQTARQGHLFHHIYSLNGLNWVDLKNCNDSNQILKNFKTNTRRDIRISSNKDLRFKSIKAEDEIALAYQLCLNNAKERNYAIRSWQSFKHTLFYLLEKGYAEFMVAYSENEMKGAILLLKAGNHFTYIMGATVKEKPDLLVGHFLQWEAIKLSCDRGFDGYNISLGGSLGVQRFKRGFKANEVMFMDSKYHWVLNPFYFKIYLFFKSNLKKQKKRIAQFLTISKRTYENRE